MATTTSYIKRIFLGRDAEVKERQAVPEIAVHLRVRRSELTEDLLGQSTGAKWDKISMSLAQDRADLETDPIIDLIRYVS